MLFGWGVLTAPFDWTIGGSLRAPVPVRVKNDRLGIGKILLRRTIIFRVIFIPVFHEQGFHLIVLLK